MNAECGCDYNDNGELIHLCELHAEVKRLNLMMDDMWDVLRDFNKTFNARISDTMQILRDRK